MTISQSTTACQHCSAARPWSAQPCIRCGAPAPAPMLPVRPVLIAQAGPKTPGIAVLLSLLWFGAGHLYANRSATGVVLMIVDLVILGIAMTGVGLVVAIPVWVLMAPIVMVLSANATHDYNRRNGLVLR